MTTRPLDLALIHPGSRSRIYQSLANTLSAIEPPVWCMLLAAHARTRGFSVAIVDAEAENLTSSEVAQRVAEMSPRLACVVVYGHQPSASTQNMTAAGEITRSLRELAPEQRIMLLGGHVAALPERTLDEEETDFVCTGEGFVTLVELLEALADPSPRLDRVRGLGYRADGGNVFTPAAPLLKSMDTDIPMQAWDLLDMSRYRAHNWHCFGHLQREPYASLYTSLGCPYHCSFCCIQAPFKTGERELGYKETVNSYRMWSPQSVVAQIDHLVQTYGVRNIKVADEMFVLNARHVMGICDALIERDYGLNIWAYARVDTVKPEMVDKLLAAGFNWLAFGIEAADENVRDDVQKGFGQREVFETVKAVRDAGINVIGNYIFGLPEDNHDTMQATLDMAIDLNCEFGNFYCAMAYPGSRLYKSALAQNLALPREWSGYSQHAVDTLPLPTRHVSGAEVLRFRDEAFVTYFTHPRYLEMVTRKFGAETAAHVKEMCGHKLERQHA